MVLVCGDGVLFLALNFEDLLASARVGEGALFKFSGTARVAKRILAQLVISTVKCL